MQSQFRKCRLLEIFRFVFWVPFIEGSLIYNILLGLIGLKHLLKSLVKLFYGNEINLESCFSFVKVEVFNKLNLFGSETLNFFKLYAKRRKNIYSIYLNKIALCDLKSFLKRVVFCPKKWRTHLEDLTYFFPSNVRLLGKEFPIAITGNCP